MYNIVPIDYKTGIFTILVILWGLEFIFFPDKNNENEAGKKSFNKILSSIILSITFSAVLAILEIGNSLISREITRNSSIIILGLGVLLRYWAIKTLGNKFSRGIDTLKNQDLVKTGPYRKLRHPLYLALFFQTLGVSLFIGNIIGIIFTIIIMIYILKKRMELEENHMENIIGNRYLKWKKNRYRFFPFIY